MDCRCHLVSQTPPGPTVVGCGLFSGEPDYLYALCRHPCAISGSVWGNASPKPECQKRDRFLTSAVHSLIKNTFQTPPCHGPWPSCIAPRSRFSPAVSGALPRPGAAVRHGTRHPVHDIATTLLASKVAYATTFLRVLNGTLAGFRGRVAPGSAVVCRHCRGDTRGHAGLFAPFTRAHATIAERSLAALGGSRAGADRQNVHAGRGVFRAGIQRCARTLAPVARTRGFCGCTARVVDLYRRV